MRQFKRKLSAFAAMLTFLSVTGVQAVSASGIADTTFVGGSAGMGFIKTEDTLHINNNTNAVGGVVVGDVKNLGSNAGENIIFGFSNISQLTGVRDISGNASNFNGFMGMACLGNVACSSYAQTGKVFIINPAGINFGAGSIVDLNSVNFSTFDFKGAKNFEGMTAAEIEAYQTNVLNKMSSNPALNGENRNYGVINFDSKYTEAFEAAGIDMNQFNGKTQINIIGANFNKYNADKTTLANSNTNKSASFVSDNITYKDSLIKTGDNYNYVTNQSSKSFGNVRLITADGVTFNYLANGYDSTYEIAQDSQNDVVRTIDIDNANLGSTDAAIRSGEVTVANISNAAGSNIKIANSIIKGTKLINKENGDIMIVGSHDVDIANSRIESVNTSIVSGENELNTFGQKGGEVFISAGKNANIKDSLVISAGANKNATNAANAGKVRINSGDKTTLDNTKVIAKGDTEITSAKEVELKDSLVQAYNTVDSSLKKDVSIAAKDIVKIHNSVIDATKDVNVIAAKDGAVTGNIVISSDLDANGKNQTYIIAQDKLAIQGANTTVDNGALVYETIKFYNDGTTGTNNVTIANNTTFTPIVNGAIGDDINIETNGNLTFDNATVKRAGYSLKFDRNADGTLLDDKTVNAINYKATTTATAKAVNVNAKSTQGNVNIVNGSNIAATKNINITADNKNVIAKNSKLNADNDTNIEATKGALSITDNTNIISANDTNLKSFETITFGADGTNSNIEQSAKISAGKNINVTSTNGDINAEKTAMTDLVYGERLTFDAKGSNNFTSKESLKGVNVDFIAGESNNIIVNDDVQLVNSSLKSPKNTIVTASEGGDVILNNVTLKVATADAKDTKTIIDAKGNVTTKDVTGTASADVNAAQKHFPQSVDYKGSVTDKTTPDTVLDVNQTKLVVNTKVNKVTPKNNDNGSITLTVKNADNVNAGIDLTAQNEAWDEQIDKGEGPEVHLHAQDGKVAITNIYTDKLTLTKDNVILAGKDTADGGKPTITVKDQGGFNLDPNKGYDPDPEGFTYEETIDSTSKIIDQKVDKDVQTDVDVKTDVVTEGDTTTTTTTTTTTETTTTTTTTTTETNDKKHAIKFDNDGNPSDFILVYDKTTTDTKVDTQVDTDVKTDVKVDVVTDCPELPDVEDEDKSVDSLINQIKIPREQMEISKTSKVSDNTVDQTSNIMSAAAKVDLSQTNINSEAKQDDEE